jgi:ComF family protein
VLGSFAKLGELLFPSRCVGCKRYNGLLCQDCRQALPLLNGVCGRCALPRGMGECRGCGKLAPSLASLRAVCSYDGVARSAVHVLKYRGGRNVSRLLGELMRQHIAQRPLRVELVIPVPLSKRRRRERGYNQAELLAREIVHAVGASLAFDALDRRERPAQQGLDAAARLRNLEGAISVGKPIDGKTVLLVDDVATTGATLSACADALKAAGAEEVRALVFARDL